VQETTVTPMDDSPARLEAVERVYVRSLVAGAVKSVHSEGALVNRGGLPLLTIDPDRTAAESTRAAQVVAALRGRLDEERASRRPAPGAESAIAQRRARRVA